MQITPKLSIGKAQVLWGFEPKINVTSDGVPALAGETSRNLHLYLVRVWVLVAEASPIHRKLIPCNAKSTRGTS